MDIGLIGGIVGGGVGLLGGALGTYVSIKNTSGPRERAFMIQVAIVTWIVVTAFVFGLLALPKPFNFLLWVPYGVFLPLGILWCNRRWRRIRAEEAATLSRVPLTTSGEGVGGGVDDVSAPLP